MGTVPPKSHRSPRQAFAGHGPKQEGAGGTRLGLLNQAPFVYASFEVKPSAMSHKCDYILASVASQPWSLTFSRFLDHHNRNPKPYRWTADPKRILEKSTAYGRPCWKKDTILFMDEH